MQHGQLPPATGDTMIDDTMAADLLSEHAWADPSTGARSCCGTLTPTTPNNLPEQPSNWRGFFRTTTLPTQIPRSTHRPGCFARAGALTWSSGGDQNAPLPSSPSFSGRPGRTDRLSDKFQPSSALTWSSGVGRAGYLPAVGPGSLMSQSTPSLPSIGGSGGAVVPPRHPKSTYQHISFV